MSKHNQTTIEINGRAYDARTGSIIDATVSRPAQSTLRPTSAAAAAALPTATPKPAVRQALDIATGSPALRPKIPAQAARSRPAQSTVVHKQPDRSQTLMRRAVKKPAAAFKPFKSKGAVDGFSARATGTKPARSLTEKQDVIRSSRAKVVQQSSRITKFGMDFVKGTGRDSIAPSSNAASQKPATRPVTSAALAPVPLQPAPQTAAPNRPGSHQNIDMRNRMGRRVGNRMSNQNRQRGTNGSASVKPSAPHRTESAEELILKGLAVADGHNAPQLPKPKRNRLGKLVSRGNRTWNIAAAGFAVLFMIGFVAFQNMPRLSVHIASARAGISATLPSYTPAGFTMEGSAEASPGEVKISYHANADPSRRFELTQKSSTWTSEALLANFLTPGNHKYQTFQDNGRTIYIYDNTNATWVNGGVWYDIAGSSSLTSDQLIKIATSL